LGVVHVHREAVGLLFLDALPGLEEARVVGLLDGVEEDHRDVELRGGIAAAATAGVATRVVVVAARGGHEPESERDGGQSLPDPSIHRLSPRVWRWHPPVPMATLGRALRRARRWIWPRSRQHGAGDYRLSRTVR